MDAILQDFESWACDGKAGIQTIENDTQVRREFHDNFGCHFIFSECSDYYRGDRIETIENVIQITSGAPVARQASKT